MFYFVFLVDEELRVFRDKIVQDYHVLPMCDLCITRSGRYDMIYFNLDDRFIEMVSKITELKRSQIFDVLWKKYSKKLKDVVVTMEIILDKIWLRVCEELQSISKKFLDGEMELKKIGDYLSMFKMNYNALEQEFILLSLYFNGRTHLDQIKKKLGVVIKKVKKLFDPPQAAQAILNLRRSVGLEGDFSEVERIEKVRQYVLSVMFSLATLVFKQMNARNVVSNYVRSMIIHVYPTFFGS